MQLFIAGQASRKRKVQVVGSYRGEVLVESQYASPFCSCRCVFPSLYPSTLSVPRPPALFVSRPPALIVPLYIPLSSSVSTPSLAPFHPPTPSHVSSVLLSTLTASHYSRVRWCYTMPFHVLYYYDRNGGHGSQRGRKYCYFGACHGSRRGMLLNPGRSAHPACHTLSHIFHACGALSDTTVTSVVKIPGVTVAPPCWLLESNNQPRHSHNPGPLRSK